MAKRRYVMTFESFIQGITEDMYISPKGKLGDHDMAGLKEVDDRSDQFYCYYPEDIESPKDGWHITAEGDNLDYQQFGTLNIFYAKHPTHGVVDGDWCGIINATSEDAYYELMSACPPRTFDPQDF